MQTQKFATRLLLSALLALSAAGAGAATPADIQADLQRTAREGNPGFAGFSAQRGRQFFATRRDSGWSCSSCHSDNPLAPGRHVKTGMEIAPFAPAAEPRRFTDATRAEKWFKRNCNDVLNRACTPEEKGDLLEYLMSLSR